jgi:hypothetical protein
MSWIVSALALSAVSSASPVVGDTQPAAVEKSAAYIRAAAKRMYKNVSTPSCKAPLGFDRFSALKATMASIEDFERRIAEVQPAANQLAVAKADAAYESTMERMCFNDDDIRFAQIHIRQTNDLVVAVLDSLEAAKSTLSAGDPGSKADPTHAELRWNFRQLIQASTPRCPLSPQLTNEEIMAKVAVKIADFRKRLEGSEFAADFDVAEQDVAQDYSNSMVECDEPDSLSRWTAQADVELLLASVEKMIPGGR